MIVPTCVGRCAPFETPPLRYIQLSEFVFVYVKFVYLYIIYIYMGICRYVFRCVCIYMYARAKALCIHLCTDGLHIHLGCWQGLVFNNTTQQYSYLILSTFHGYNHSCYIIFICMCMCRCMRGWIIYVDTDVCIYFI